MVITDNGSPVTLHFGVYFPDWYTDCAFAKLANAKCPNAD